MLHGVAVSAVPTAGEFDEFFREWFPRLVSLGTTMTGRRDVAHELAQEALLRAHRDWDRVGAYEVPGAWLRKVAVHLMIDHQRSAASEQRAVERLRLVGQATSAPRLDQWAELVAELPPRQRSIVTLFYADDQPVEAIAELLEIAPGTVKAQLFKARESLRERLEDRS